jgi:hypothetical protein
LRIAYGEDEQECIVFSDSELPTSKTYAIRGEGIWADLIEEVPKEHWSLSLESFALRVPVDEYLAFVDDPQTLLIGDRIPFGYELDLTSTEEDDWMLSGDIFIEKHEIEFEDVRTQFVLK